MRRWEESEPYTYDNNNYYNNNNINGTVGQSQNQFYGGQNGGRDWADARITASGSGGGGSRGYNGGAVRRFDGNNNDGPSSGMWGRMSSNRQSAAPSSVSSFGMPYNSNQGMGGGGGGRSRGGGGLTDEQGPIDVEQEGLIVSADRFIGGHGFGDKYDTNQRALERRRSQNGGRNVNRNQRGGGGGGMVEYDDGEEMMGMAITDATFTNALEDTERPSERGRHNKMWRKARQQRKLENHILDTTAKYRDRTYGEGGAHSSDEEDHPRQNNQKGGGAGVGGVGGRRVQIEEGNLPSDGDTTAAGEDDDDDDEEEDEDAMSEDGASASDPRQLAKERRREERRERKERKRTRKLTRLMLQEALGVKSETLKSLKKSQRYVADAEEAGQSAVKSLHNQSEQLGRIDNELDGLAPLMERAKRDINSIARRMFRDKCFVVLCLLVLVALIVVIALFARSSVMGLVRTIGGVTPTVKPTLGPVANQTAV